MSEAESRTLPELLGVGATLPAVQRLDAADAGRLAGLIEQAQAHQGRQIMEASEQALGHVPALLRPAVRKLLFS